jgi:preprotein translocase subunit SecG
MQDLLDIQKKYNITDKDLFVLSYLSSQLKESSLLEKQRINTKLKNILSKYNISLLDKIKSIKALTNSTYHKDLVLIEKYSDAHNSEEYNVSEKKVKKSVIMLIVLFFVVFFAITIALSNKSSSENNSNESTEISSVNGTYSYTDNSADLNVTVNGNMWSFRSTIKSGFGNEYDNDNSQYDSGIMKGNDLYDKSGMVKIGYVSGNSLTTSFSGRQITLNKN